MKKRVFEKILTIVSIILTLVFAGVLLTTIFGGIDVAEFDNSLVRGLFVILTALYVVAAVLIIVNLFSDNDIVKEIAVNRDRTGSTKATAGIIKKLAKKYIKTVEGVKCGKITLVMTEYGVNLRINIKLDDKEIKDTTTYIKKLLDDVFDTTLDYRFHSIDFKVQQLKSQYQPPVSEIRAETEKEISQERALRQAREAEEKAKAIEDEKKIQETINETAPDYAETHDQDIIAGETEQEMHAHQESDTVVADKEDVTPAKTTQDEE